MFTVHVICFAIEQYKNKQTREASLVMYKLFNKKKVFTWLYWTSLLQVVILWNVCQRFFYVQYLLLRKKTGTKNKFVFFYYKWSLACEITQLLTIKWKILFPRKKKNYLWNVYVLGASAIFFMHSVWREKLRISAAFNIKNSASER